MAALLAAFCAQAQEKENYFDVADCDENGWLWFDTEAKIEKYVGWDGQKILLETATYENEDGENPEPYASATIKGVGNDEDHTVGSEGCKTGAIVLCESNGSMAQTGGAILLHLPSCLEMAVCLSCEARMLTVLTGGPGELEVIDLAVIKGQTVFNPLSKGGIYTYANMQLLENGSTGLTLLSNDPVTGCLRNCNSYPLYIHGIKIMVKKGDGGDQTPGKKDDDDAIASVKASTSAAPCYNMAGIQVTKPAKGFYIQDGKKVVR